MRFLFKTSYEQDLRLAKHGGHVFWYSLLAVALAAAPWVAPEYWLAQLTFVLIYAIVGLGLMLLAGFTGLFSLGHAAFLGGAAYAAGQQDRLEPWVRSLTWRSVASLLDWKLGGGLMAGGKLTNFFRSQYEDPGIEQLPKAFGCVATDLGSGREVWLREGSVIDAVRASIALPGVFTPARSDGRLLVDGGLVNPVPVSLCRAMGADIVIAVDLNWELVTRRRPRAKLQATPDEEADEVQQATALTHSGRLEALMTRIWPFNGAQKIRPCSG